MATKPVLTVIPALELKGSLVTLMTLRVLDPDPETLTQQFVKKIEQAPDFFKNAPIILDLQALQEAEKTIDLAFLVALLKRYELVPVAIKGGTFEQNQAALALSLGILSASATKPATRQPAVNLIPTLNSNENTTSTNITQTVVTKVITQPVRSGQQIVEMNGDLVILSSVSAGAEVLAQRHIHVYGALRGRALAGVNGDQDARIFCQVLDAELVSVAGHYIVNEDLDSSVRNKAAQIFLQEGQLAIQALEPYPR